MSPDARGPDAQAPQATQFTPPPASREASKNGPAGTPRSGTPRAEGRGGVLEEERQASLRAPERRGKDTTFRRPEASGTSTALRRALARARDGKTLDAGEATTLLHARGADLDRLLGYAARARDAGLKAAGRPGV